MKISRDASGKTTVDFMGSVLPDGRKIEDLLKNRLGNGLVDVLREFGIVGVTTYIGGIIMLYHFPKQGAFDKQVLYAISGIALLFLAALISYSRIKAQSAREKALIEMTQNTNNRLAEQLAKGMTNEQVAAIIQKIRQNQRDMLTAIFKQTIEK